MQAYYMKKKNISIPVSAVYQMIITITYKLVLVVVGIGVAVFGRGIHCISIWKEFFLFSIWDWD